MPEPKQEAAYKLLWDKITSFILFGGGAGGGKTWLGCEWLITQCYNYPGTRWFIGRKELKRLKNTSYLTFKKVCRHHGIPDSDWKLNGQDNYIEFVAGNAKGSRIDLLDLKYKPADPLYERFGSEEFTGGWIEEAGEIEFLCFDVLKTRIGRHLNDVYGLFPAKLLLTCNPTQNWLYRIFYKPWKKGTLSKKYAFIQSLFGDNSHTAGSYGEQLDEITDPVMKARLKEGLWEYGTDELSLMPYDSIIEIFFNELDPDPRGYISADIARMGSDKVVIGAWRGLDLYRIRELSKLKLSQTKEHLRDMMTDEQISYDRTVVDEDGVGGGIVDMMEGVHGFMGGRSPILKPKTDIEEKEERYANLPASYLQRENYKNLRSQCYFLLADRVNKHSIKISADLTELQKELIIEELQQIKREDTVADAPLQVVSKDDIKEAIGRSPDYADMLMMRMYFELIKIDESKKEVHYNPPNMELLAEKGIDTPWGGGVDYGIGFGH